MYINRTIEQTCLQVIQDFKVLAVTGPRQSGKTTLIRKIFPNFEYINLENMKTREQVHSNPLGFLKQYPQGIIFDEAQKYPELFSYIQVYVDETNKNGQIILTGSSNFLLMKSLSQSLAGRVGILNLLPLSISEINAAFPDQFNIYDYCFKGGYPVNFPHNNSISLTFDSYVQTYLEKDLRDLLNVKNLLLFKKFLTLCAARVGQLLNKENISSDLGISVKTINEWLTVLETSFIIFKLQPWHGNINKRLIKTPKIYFTDTGLLCHLLGIEISSQVDTHFAKGLIFENLIVADFLKTRFNRGKNNNLYFYRDKQETEIDLIQTNNDKLDLYEIKSAPIFHKEFTKNLKLVASYFTNEVNSMNIIYCGKNDIFSQNDIKLVNWKTIDS